MSRPRPYFDAFVAECPTREVLDRIGSKWVSLVIVALASGPSGYRELLRRIDGVSPKMLTQTLRSLEFDGLIGKETTGDTPPRSNYCLTPLGETLLPLLAAVKAWAEAHMPDIDAAQARSLAQPSR